MPQAQFIQEGCSVDYRPTVDTPAGTVVIQGDLVGITKKDIKANALGALAVEGVIEFAKTAGTAMAVGAFVYWDNVNQVVTTTAGALKKVGRVIRAAAAGDTLVRVLLSQP